MQLTLDVNGGQHHLDVAPDRRLVDVIRYDLGLLGTKLACGEGACGACAVILDGRAVASCILLAAAAEGHEIRTIEGISLGGPSPLQEAFVAEDALQCGFCTPGQIVTATALLERNGRPTAGEIRAAMAGNLCRCGAYPKIERAILQSAPAGA
jgi:aerobic-type carbon monoxide dehydrogenase small subunit (CoxS/CutS family)